MSPTRTLAALRFGCGLPVADGSPDSPDTMLAALAGPDKMAEIWPIMGLAESRPLFLAFRAIKGEGKQDPALAAKREALLLQIGAQAQQAQRATFARAVDARDGFRERLVAFWADHFSVVAASATATIYPFALVEDAIRPNLTGNFATLLTDVTLHPAMLTYLDQISSVGPNSQLGKKQHKGLNENLAREVIELHSLGVGAGYSQQDVTEMAKLLTGLVVDPADGTQFEARRAEPGAKRIMGKTYDGDGLAPIKAALADLALRPETAAHIARKLVVHFVADAPDAALVNRIATAYSASGGSLMACYASLLSDPAAWHPAPQKARQPYDFLIASLRALGITGQTLQDMPYKHFKARFLDTMARMGQPFKRPPGPNGFAEAAEEWITPQGLARRITWAMQVPDRLVNPLPDPVELAQRCLADRASEALLWAAAKAEDRQQGVGLVLASAEFNRR